MKRFAITSIFMLCSTSYAVTPHSKHIAATTSCSTPAVLRITKVGNDLYYQLDQSKPHKLFTLGEVSNAVTSCNPEKMLFVVADPDVPIRAMIVPEKEQITKVRYFMMLTGTGVWEISMDQIFPKLPITPDILPEPADDDSPVPPTKIPAMKSPR